ncbi:MAG: hypothetical protein WD342_11540 [Verrucomicrobiales bacterium]
MSAPPRKAPPTIRELLVDALKSPSRRVLDGNSQSRSFLDLWDLRAETLFADLADGLENHDLLYIKPKNSEHDPQRYQCVLAYPEEDGLPALDIHVTLSPRGEPPRVKVAVHPSDTVRSLPKIHV